MFRCCRFSIHSILLRFLVCCNTDAFVSLTVTTAVFFYCLCLSAKKDCIQISGYLATGDFSSTPESWSIRFLTVAADRMFKVPGPVSTSFACDTLLDSALRYLLRTRFFRIYGLVERDCALAIGLAVSTSDREKPASCLGSIT